MDSDVRGPLGKLAQRGREWRRLYHTALKLHFDVLQRQKWIAWDWGELEGYHCVASHWGPFFPSFVFVTLRACCSSVGFILNLLRLVYIGSFCFHCEIRFQQIFFFKELHNRQSSVIVDVVLMGISKVYYTDHETNYLSCVLAYLCLIFKNSSSTSVLTMIKHRNIFQHD